MKPTPQISPALKRYCHEMALKAKRHQPLTDYNFQRTLVEPRALRNPDIAASPSPKFRDLSREFLRTETKRTYLVELAFFAIIVVVSAWPIASMLEAMKTLIK